MVPRHLLFAEGVARSFPFFGCGTLASKTILQYCESGHGEVVFVCELRETLFFSITIRHMKPFVQTKLQCKVQSKQLQEITEGEMGFEAFVYAHNRLLNLNAIFQMKFAEFAAEGQFVTFANFMRFINIYQGVS